MAANELSLWCLTLAAWMSGTFEDKAGKLANMFLRLPEVGTQSALLACLIANYCPASVRAELVAIAYPKHESELASAAAEIGLPLPGFRQMLPESARRIIIRSIDDRLTGGGNIGLI
jgi:hypothetical protein